MAEFLKPLLWVASSKKDLITLPGAIQGKIGYMLELVQRGEMPLDAKVLKGFKGASVLEIRADHDKSTFERYTRSDSLRLFMSCMCFRRNRKEESKHRPMSWI